MIQLYHGSNIKIETPDLLHSKPFKDFGRGFYLSSDKQQAWDMALQKVSQTKEGQAEVTEFLFDETLMTSSELTIVRSGRCLYLLTEINNECNQYTTTI